MLILLAYPALIAPYVCVGAAVTLALRTWPRQAGGPLRRRLAGRRGGLPAGHPPDGALGPPLAAGTAAMAAAATASLLARPRGGTALAGAAVAGAGPARRRRRRGPAGGAPNVLPGKPLAVLLDPARHPGAALLAVALGRHLRVDVFRSPGAALLWAGPPIRPRRRRPPRPAPARP